MKTASVTRTGENYSVTRCFENIFIPAHLSVWPPAFAPLLALWFCSLCFFLDPTLKMNLLMFSSFPSRKESINALYSGVSLILDSSGAHLKIECCSMM